MKKTLTKEQLNELKNMFGTGMNQVEIAKHFSMTDDTLRRILKENELEYPKGHKCKCIVCGATFWSNIKTAKVCSKEHHAACVICGKDFIVDRKDPKNTCSRKCTSLLKYGTEHPLASQQVRDKIQTTIKYKYGVVNVSQLSDHNEKSKQTCLEKYGAESYAASEEGKTTIAATNVEKYGVPCIFSAGQTRDQIDQANIGKYGTVNPSTLPQFVEKQKQTMLDRYGVENPMHVPEVVDKFKKPRDPEIFDRISATIQDRYGVPWACMRPEARQYTAISQRNLKFKELLEAQGIECSLEFQIENRSYDIKVGKTLIEIDPTCTHNSFMSIFENTKPTAYDYHKMKSNLAEKYGYRCIHVFDWDSKDKIVEMLKPCTMIHARKCEVKKVDQQTADLFTLKYHLKGSCKGQKVNYGLYYQDELVEIMTFGTPRYNNNYDYELLRLCTKFEIKAIGGASKLFKEFTKDHPDKSVISYCDRSKFTGHVYESIGMTYLKTSDPSKIWSKGNQRITQNLLNQRGYDQLFNANYGEGTSNENLMLQNGWLPVYDCGQAVYIFNS